jgi:acylphosphatase
MTSTRSQQAVHCLVSGRVQGVFYRSSTLAAAEELGLQGWARNLDDGRVELVVGGAPEAIEKLVAWLWQGPAAARVTGVVVEAATDFPAPGFAIR